MIPIRYRSEYGVYHGLQISEGKKYISVVLLQFPIKIQKLEKREGRYITEVDLPVLRVQKALLRALRAQYGNLRDAPKGVKAILK